MDDKVEIRIKGTGRVIGARRGDNLGRILAAHGLLPLPCGGNGLCGLCRVRVWGSVNRPTIYEKIRGLNGETRLACQTRILGDVEVELPEIMPPRAPLFSLLVEPRRRNPLVKPVSPEVFPGAVMRVVVREPGAGLQPVVLGEAITYTGGDSGKVLLVDLGTTKIAYQLVSINGDILGEDVTVDPLNKYGADIVTRMTHILDDPGKLYVMSRELREHIAGKLGETNAGVILVAGNSVMQHIFNGLPIESLAAKPYQPHVKGPVYSWINNIPTITMPMIAGYVGGDAYSELVASLELSPPKPYMIIDLGTNTETILVTKDKIYATSTPAGPAFEGHITSGSTVYLGGITRVKITGEEYGRPVFEKEYMGKPAGLLGTGLISVVAELLRHGYIDSRGRIVRGYTRMNNVKTIVIDEENNVVVTQLDIRELQKALAAVKTSWKILLDKAGLRPEALETVIIAGSFGSSIDPMDLVDLGMAPADDTEKIMYAGNMVLSGLRTILLRKEYLIDYESVLSRVEHVNLAEEENYMRIWIESLDFK